MAKSKTSEVTSIVIRYSDGETKELALDDARALYRQLDDLFRDRPVSVPIVIERERWPFWWPRYPNPIYCDGGTSIKELPDHTPQVWCKSEPSELMC